MALAGIRPGLIFPNGRPGKLLRRILNPSLSISVPVAQVMTTCPFPGVKLKEDRRIAVGLIVGADNGSPIINGDKLVLTPQITLVVVLRLVVMFTQTVPSLWKSFRDCSVA